MTDLRDQIGPSRRLAILGGGITGLAAAEEALRIDLQLQVDVFEASSRLGGVLSTIQRDDWLLEESADNFITNIPWGLELCRRIGISDELIETSPTQRYVSVVRGGKLHRVPYGFTLMQPTRIAPLLTTPLLSPLGRLRALAEYFVPARSRAQQSQDESLASFARRRLGREAFEQIVQPLIGGIYTADPERLSILATLPRFVEMEQKHGGLIRAARAEKAARAKAPDKRAEIPADMSGARYQLFVAPRTGMQRIIEALVAHLPPKSLHCDTRVQQVSRVGSGWQITTQHNGQAPEAREYDALIVALPTASAADLLHVSDPALAGELASIEYAGCSVVLCGYACEQLTRPLDGFGFVVPEIEGRPILAVSYASQKFPGRAPVGHALFRVFVGGAMHPDLTAWDEATLLRVISKQLEELIGIQGPPMLWHVVRWGGHMPQYHVGHLDRLARIDERLKALPSLAVAGNAYRGVGVPHCIHSGQQAAQRVLQVR